MGLFIGIVIATAIISVVWFFLRKLIKLAFALVIIYLLFHIGFVWSQAGAINNSDYGHHVGETQLYR